jgi:TRAP-type C4-dicarboxylate transport system permease small subunit
MLMGLMLLGAGDVIGRYVFNRPITGALEIGQILMGGVVLFGWAYTQARRGHIRVEIVIARLPPRLRAILDFATLLLALALFSLIMWQSVVIALASRKHHELIPTVNIPAYPFLLFVLPGAFFLCLEFIIQMVHLIPQIRRGD